MSDIIFCPNCFRLAVFALILLIGKVSAGEFFGHKLREFAEIVYLVVFCMLVKKLIAHIGSELIPKLPQGIAYES